MNAFLQSLKTQYREDLWIPIVIAAGSFVFLALVFVQGAHCWKRHRSKKRICELLNAGKRSVDERLYLEKSVWEIEVQNSPVTYNSEFWKSLATMTGILAGAVALFCSGFWDNRKQLIDLQIHVAEETQKGLIIRSNDMDRVNLKLRNDITVSTEQLRIATNALSSANIENKQVLARNSEIETRVKELISKTLSPTVDGRVKTLLENLYFHLRQVEDRTDLAFGDLAQTKNWADDRFGIGTIEWHTNLSGKIYPLSIEILREIHRRNDLALSAFTNLQSVLLSH